MLTTPGSAAGCTYTGASSLPVRRFHAQHVPVLQLKLRRRLRIHFDGQSPHGARSRIGQFLHPGKIRAAPILVLQRQIRLEVIRELVRRPQESRLTPFERSFFPLARRFRGRRGVEPQPALAHDIVPGLTLRQHFFKNRFRSRRLERHADLLRDIGQRLLRRPGVVKRLHERRRHRDSGACRHRWHNRRRRFKRVVIGQQQIGVDSRVVEERRETHDRFDAGQHPRNPTRRRQHVRRVHAVDQDHLGVRKRLDHIAALRQPSRIRRGRHHATGLANVAQHHVEITGRDQRFERIAVHDRSSGDHHRRFRLAQLARHLSQPLFVQSTNPNQTSQVGRPNLLDNILRKPIDISRELLIEQHPHDRDNKLRLRARPHRQPLVRALGRHRKSRFRLHQLPAHARTPLPEMTKLPRVEYRRRPAAQKIRPDSQRISRAPEIVDRQSLPPEHHLGRFPLERMIADRTGDGGRRPQRIEKALDGKRPTSRPRAGQKDDAARAALGDPPSHIRDRLVPGNRRKLILSARTRPPLRPAQPVRMVESLHDSVSPRAQPPPLIGSSGLPSIFLMQAMGSRSFSPPRSICRSPRITRTITPQPALHSPQIEGCQASSPGTISRSDTSSGISLSVDGPHAVVASPADEVVRILKNRAGPF